MAQQSCYLEKGVINSCPDPAVSRESSLLFLTPYATHHVPHSVKPDLLLTLRQWMQQTPAEEKKKSLDQWCFCVSGNASSLSAARSQECSELQCKDTAGREQLCTEEGYSSVCSLNYRAWKPIFSASVFKNVGYRLRLFIRDSRPQMKCPVCGFARRFPFCYFELLSISELFYVADYQMRPKNASYRCSTS